MADAAPAIEYRFIWDAPLMREVMDVAQKRGGRRGARWRIVGFAVLAGFFIVMAWRLGDYFLLIFPLIFAVIPLLRSWSVGRWVKGELSSPLRQGPSTVKVGPDGLDVIHPLCQTHYEWPLVINVIDGDLALHLMVSPVTSMPVPDAALPEGISRDILRERVELWRTGGMF